jgi:hypothetical protein
MPLFISLLKFQAILRALNLAGINAGDFRDALKERTGCGTRPSKQKRAGARNTLIFSSSVAPVHHR